VRSWLDDPQQPVFRLFGYAGTGKTTLAQHLVDDVDGLVLFAAYTGKAALVLREKGCFGASTIHSLIYQPKEKSGARLAHLELELQRASDDGERALLLKDIEKERENLSRPSFHLNLDSELNDATLLVLDEVSMVGKNIAHDLLGFECPILALGDPAQLPPVGDEGYFTDHKPDVLLTEIHRQAENSPILNIATTYRTGGIPNFGELDGGTRVIRKGTLSIDELFNDHDQIIVGKNATRRHINDLVREKVLGYGKIPVPKQGERLVCYRNNGNYGLMNGTQWIVNACDIIDDERLVMHIKSADVPDADYSFEVPVWRHRFEGREKEIPWYEIGDAADFDFGYAITCHKSQGSQWGRVAVVDEGGVFREKAAHWRYTAVTRAAQQLTLIR
jgi:exodeoxyribonuclease-5